MRILVAGLMLSASVAGRGQAAAEPDAATIMARVAANQDRSQAERVHFIYVQHARVVSAKGGTVRCEEVTDTRMVPTQTGSGRQLLTLHGRLLAKGKYVTYDRIPTHKKDFDGGVEQDEADIDISIGNDNDTDRDLVEDMRENLTDTRSKDGIGSRLFPLTTKAQAEYSFHLVGREKRNGRDVFHITFAPRDKSDFIWKGDAYLDSTAYEPVLVRTTMSRNIPFAVRTLLGTSVPGLAFTVIYAPEPEDSAGSVWFPVSFGTEFKLKVLFFFSRQITLSAQNRDFQRTHVKSTVMPVTEGQGVSQPQP